MKNKIKMMKVELPVVRYRYPPVDSGRHRKAPEGNGRHRKATEGTGRHRKATVTNEIRGMRPIFLFSF